MYVLFSFIQTTLRDCLTLAYFAIRVNIGDDILAAGAKEHNISWIAN